MRLVARDELGRVGGRRTFPHLSTGETAVRLRNAERASLPAIASRAGEAGGNPL